MWMFAVISLGCISRQEIVRLHVKIVVCRSKFFAFPKQFVWLHSYQKCMNVLFNPYPLGKFSLVVLFLIISF